METGYQRGKIQEESMLYEHKKHDGSLPLIGVNTFRNPNGDAALETVELQRSTDDEKQSQLARLKAFQEANSAEGKQVLQRLRQTVIENGNTFAVLMDAVRCCSLGQITQTLFEVGGRYRRNM
jgi:isobutyryl-CoA mutase